MASSLTAEKILVTGASGFIGTHLVQRLCNSGAAVTAVVTPDRLTDRYKALTEGFERIVLDDVAQIGDIVRAVKPRYVVNLNAYISLDRTLRAVEQSIQANLISAISLLTACTEVKCDRVILMGSCEEYGQKHCPFDPALALDPNSPYGASKAAASCYARMFYSSFKLPTVVLRPSVVYGPGQSPRMLISMVLRALAEGKTIAVTTGLQTRDFIYIDDMIDSILLSLQEPLVVGLAWNIGTGEIVTVRKCLELIERITGHSGLIQYGAKPYADSERFHYEPMVQETFETLRWKPSIMLEEGLRRTWDFVHNDVLLQSGVK